MHHNSIIVYVVLSGFRCSLICHTHFSSYPLPLQHGVSLCAAPHVRCASADGAGSQERPPEQAIRAAMTTSSRAKFKVLSVVRPAGSKAPLVSSDGLRADGRALEEARAACELHDNAIRKQVVIVDSSTRGLGFLQQPCALKLFPIALVQWSYITGC